MMKETITFLILFLVCCNTGETSLDSFFNTLEKESPDQLLNEFRTSPLDSVILNNSKYNEIFVITAEKIFEDPKEAENFESFFKQNQIELEGMQVKWAIVAAFHNKLNGKGYDFKQLLQEMIDLSNQINEE